MKMGEYIKYLRTDLGFTQDELGSKLNPPVNRAAVNKWENGSVENIKRTHIQQLSKIFNVSPVELMCFNTSDESKLARESKLLDEIKEVFGEDVKDVVVNYLQNKTRYTQKDKM